VKTTLATPVVLSVLAAIAVPANAGIDTATRHMGGETHMVVEQSESRILQERTPGPVRPHTDGPNPINGHDRSLRPVTRGMQAPSGLQAQKQRLALAGPNAATAAKTMRDVSAAKPKDIVIDVIVAYTRKAMSNYAEIERELVHLAIEETNRSFRLSNLGHIELRLVHTYRTDYVEEGAHFDHVWRFADKGDGYMEEIHSLRDKHRADVAILVVDDPKGCGLATRVRADADDCAWSWSLSADKIKRCRAVVGRQHARAKIRHRSLAIRVGRHADRQRTGHDRGVAIDNRNDDVVTRRRGVRISDYQMHVVHAEGQRQLQPHAGAKNNAVLGPFISQRVAIQIAREAAIEHGHGRANYVGVRSGVGHRGVVAGLRCEQELREASIEETKPNYLARVIDVTSREQFPA